MILWGYPRRLDTARLGVLGGRVSLPEAHLDSCAHERTHGDSSGFSESVMDCFVLDGNTTWKVDDVVVWVWLIAHPELTAEPSEGLCA